MTKCLKIVLARPGRSYRPGEPIRGQVRVRTRTDRDHGPLTLAPTWKCGRETHRTETTLEPAGRWSAGTDRSYAFEIAAPLGPLTYHGARLGVSWTLQAWANLGWFHAVEALQDFDLVRWLPDESFGECDGYRALPVRAPADYVAGSSEPPGVVTDDGSMKRGASTFGRLAYHVRRLRLKRKLGGRIETRAPDRVHAGDVLDVRVVVPAHAPIQRLYVGVGAQDVTLHQTRADIWHVSTVESVRYDIVEPLPEEPSSATRWLARLCISEDVPVSFSAREARLEWFIETVCTTLDGSEWRERRPLVVLPPRVTPCATSPADVLDRRP